MTTSRLWKHNWSAKALYDFYQVREAVWPLKAGSDNILDVTKIKTNLKLTDGNLEPEEGYTNGKLPANIEIRYRRKRYRW